MNIDMNISTHMSQIERAVANSNVAAASSYP
jgi:hypothetical protein